MTPFYRRSDRQIEIHKTKKQQNGKIFIDINFWLYIMVVMYKFISIQSCELKRKMKGFFMTDKVLSKNDIEDYILPQLKILKALFLALKLEGTLISLDLLEDVLDIELERSYKVRSPKKLPHQ